ncbi:hypothetical protein Clacol_006567 [Clathrus columnatus]|uniref:Carboxylesterase type B domain-containing protein n=1 Tax=Clathrus columnatus TaxID=1419009 RepID=A0AAV5AH84_9AGAM|nr:hypothetical protein Clacol_006567 [Clathrus columnatus]
MRSVAYLFLTLSVAVASPITSLSISSILCHIPILEALCPRAPPPVSIVNPIGLRTAHGVTRYVVKNQLNPAALPPLCPQPNVDLSQVSEDCLDLVLYVPPTAKSTPGGLPTLMWIHGGSFFAGGASNPGLDGSNLAIATNSLGLLPPSSNSMNDNLALQDIMTALTFLHNVLPYFGGTPGTPRLTMSGQSSGASMIRALLGTPAAWPLFNNVWFHSDTIDYGFLTSGALTTLQNAWVEELGCTGSASNCARNMDLEALITHQDNLLSAAPNLGPEYYFASPIRPSPSRDFILYTFTNSSTFPPASDMKPVVLTNVKDEAMPSVYTIFPDSNGPISLDMFEGFLIENIGQNRSNQVLDAPFYQFNSSVDLRTVLQTLSTDEVWRCPAWTLARNLATRRSPGQYTGLFTVGITYPPNVNITECIQPGSVCHQDDIEVLFGTGPTQIPLTQELQARYSSYIRTSIPNALGYPEWQLATSTDVKTLNLGGQPPIPTGACTPTFWGDEILFDYQVNHE